MRLIVDGETIITPRTYAWAVGSEHILTVPDETQTVQGLRYTHGKWSDGDAASHRIVSNPHVAVYTANFVRRVPVVLVQQPNGSVSVSPPSSDGFILPTRRSL